MENFVVDLGFSSAKWVMGKKKGRVISVYQDRGDRETLVGEDAIDNPGGVAYLRTPQHLVSYYPLFVAKCLAEAKAKGKVSLAVGLPAKYFEEQVDIKGGDVERLKASLLEMEQVEDVVVLAQGLGGIQSFLNTPTGQEISGLVLGVDIGFNTIIYTLFDPSKGKIIFTDTLYKRGISQLVDNYLKPKIQNITTGVAMTPVEISHLMEQGYITIGTDKYDLTPEIEEAAEKYVTSILEEIMEDIKANLSVTRPLNTIVFFGGGTSHLKGIGSTKVNVVLLKEPEYANARGFMSMLEG